MTRNRTNWQTDSTDWLTRPDNRTVRRRYSMREEQKILVRSCPLLKTEFGFLCFTNNLELLFQTKQWKMGIWIGASHRRTMSVRTSAFTSAFTKHRPSIQALTNFSQLQPASASNSQPVSNSQPASNSLATSASFQPVNNQHKTHVFQVVSRAVGIFEEK